METQNFSLWLYQEVTSARLALLVLLEEKDRLLYREAFALRNDYMVKIGSFEEEVLALELEISLLRRKAELIQIAVNQRRPIDPESIERQLREEREQKLSALKQAEVDPAEMRDLSREEEQELQEKYRKIVRDYHPQVNPGITAMEKALYEKAVEAYRTRDLEAIRLICGMLYDDSALKGTELGFSLELSAETPEQDVFALAERLSTDYSLAAQLFPCFQQTEHDRTLLDTAESCRQQCGALEAELRELQKQFPFSAKELLGDPAKTEGYLAGLKVRLSRGKEEKQALEEKIGKMLEAAHG